MAFTIPNNNVAGVAPNPQSLIFSRDIDTFIQGMNDTGVISGCQVVQHAAGANASVDVAGGLIISGGIQRTVTAANPIIGIGAFSPPNRIDIVVADSNGVVQVRSGTQADNAEPPAMVAGDVPLAFVHRPQSANTVVTANIIDKRVTVSAVHALLSGRAGGQTLNGGTGPADNMFFRSTLHGTKGYTFIGSSGMFALNENNGFLGLGGFNVASLGNGGSPRILEVHNDGPNAYGLLQLTSNSVAAGELIGSVSMGSTGPSAIKRAFGIDTYLASSGVTNANSRTLFFSTVAGVYAERIRIHDDGGFVVSSYINNSATPAAPTNVSGGDFTTGRIFCATYYGSVNNAIHGTITLQGSAHATPGPVIVKGDTVAPVNAGASTNGIILRVANTINNGAVDFGLGPGYVWMQTRNPADMSLHYPLLLNQFGGNVGINGAAGAPLDVNGQINTSVGMSVAGTGPVGLLLSGNGAFYAPRAIVQTIQVGDNNRTIIASEVQGMALTMFRLDPIGVNRVCILPPATTPYCGLIAIMMNQASGGFCTVTCAGGDIFLDHLGNTPSTIVLNSNWENVMLYPMGNFWLVMSRNYVP